MRLHPIAWMTVGCCQQELGGIMGVRCNPWAVLPRKKRFSGDALAPDSTQTNPSTDNSSSPLKR